MSSSSIVELKQIFEYELRRKMAIKAKQSTSEFIMLSNAFRFYDTFNTGTVNKIQWLKAFNKIGLSGFSEKDLSLMFDSYDIHMQGVIDYKQFANNLYNDNQSPSNLTERETDKREQDQPIPIKEEQTPIENQQTPSVNQVQLTDQSMNQQTHEKNRYINSTPMKFEIKKYFKYLLEVLFYNLNTENGVTYLSFASKIKIMEDRFNKVISFDNFMKCLFDSQIEINYKDARDFFSLLDLSDQGNVSTEELLRLLRGQLTEERRIKTIEQFALLDQYRQGRCKISEVKNMFNPKGHPEVKMGRKTENEIYQEFIYSFDTFLQLKERNVYCTLDDFIEYYSIISGCIDNDEYFKAMITSVWSRAISQTNNQRQAQEVNNQLHYSQSNNNSMPLKNNYINNINIQKNIENRNNNNNRIDLTSTTSQKRTNKRAVRQPNLIQYNPIHNTYILPDNQTNYESSHYQIINSQSNENRVNHKPVESIMKLKQLLIHRGFKGILGFQRHLRLFDKNNSRKIFITEFDSLCQSYCLNLSKDEINSIFSFLDIELVGEIKYDSLMNVLLGDLKDNRQKIVRRVFNILDKDNIGQIDQTVLKQAFNPSRHPDVLNRRKTEDEVLCEWIDCIDAFCAFNNIYFNRRLSLDDFYKLYTIISITIDDDKAFELLMNNVWNLDKQNNNSNYPQSSNHHPCKLNHNSRSSCNLLSNRPF